jgi:putative membrane protein
MTAERSVDTHGAERFQVEANAQTHFAWLRTRLSAERTLMSYNRTAIALIGFGFTIYQFLAKLNISKTVAPPSQVNAPQWLGLLLIGTGLLFLAIGVIDYRAFIKYLNLDHFRPVGLEKAHSIHTGTPLAAALLFVAGAFAFAAVLLRI